MKKFDEKLNDAMGGHEAEEVIPVLAGALAMLAFYTRADPQMFSTYLLSVIRDTYVTNQTPPKKEMN
ncbi:MAG: hypothetical protein WCH09_04095 [Bacteroidota bacterium]|jgi:hypothetical protein